MNKMEQVVVKHILREANKCADILAKLANDVLFLLLLLL